MGEVVNITEMSSKNRADETYTVATMKIDRIKLNDEFVSLFNIDSVVLDSIVNDIRINGYDMSQPVVVWKEKCILIDGHTRLKAVEILGIEDIPVIYHSFKNESEALKHACKLQFNRRNITDSNLIDLIPKVLEPYIKSYGEGSKADFIRERFTTLSKSKTKQILVVLDRATQEDIDKIRNSEVSIYQIYMSYKNTYIEHQDSCDDESINNLGIDIGNRNDGSETSDNQFASVLKILHYQDSSIRYDTEGNFYLFVGEQNDEVKILKLQKEFNSWNIKDKLKSFLQKIVAEDEVNDNE